MVQSEPKIGFEVRQDYKLGLTLVRYHCKGLTMDSWKSLKWDSILKLRSSIRPGLRTIVSDDDGVIKQQF